MKKALFFLLFLPFCLFSGEVKTELGFYKETEHFQIFCDLQDHEAADLLLKIAETNFEKFSKDFQIFYRKKIKIEMYPNVQSYHETKGFLNAPDWQVVSSSYHTIQMVSPNQPGRVHTFESIVRCGMVGLADLFLMEKYPSCEARWLYEGVSFHESHYYIRPVVKEWICAVREKKSQIPSVTQLEQNESNEAFADIDGFRSSYALVEFIKEKWSWETALKLLEDYSSFEKILGVSKEELKDQWILFLHEKYPTAW